MATLVEKYAKRLGVSESVYKEANGGEQMPQYKKVLVARVLENTKNYLNEAFTAATATQSGGLGSVNATTTPNMGNFKQFCLNLVTVALPNLIGTDLVITQPMASMQGYLTYLKYELGNGKLANGTFRLGAMDEVRASYTAKSVVESFTATASQTAFTVAFGNGQTGDASDVKVVSVTKGTTTLVKSTDYTVNGQTVTLTSAASANDVIKIAYTYDNLVIPQNVLPTFTATLKNIPLNAKARRIAVNMYAA